jgi:hypothetical protein
MRAKRNNAINEDTNITSINKKIVTPNKKKEKMEIVHEKVGKTPKNDIIVHKSSKKKELPIKKEDSSKNKAKSKNERISDKKKKKILADYAGCQNFHEVARINKVSAMTVKRIVNKEETNNTELIQVVTQNQDNNTKSMLEYMDSITDFKKEIMGNILTAINEKAKKPDFLTSIRDLGFVAGILIDKEYKAEELRLRREEVSLKREELELKKKELAKNNNNDETTFNSFMSALKESSEGLWNDENIDTQSSLQTDETKSEDVTSDEKEN